MYEHLRDIAWRERSRRSACPENALVPLLRSCIDFLGAAVAVENIFDRRPGPGNPSAKELNDLHWGQELYPGTRKLLDMLLGLANGPPSVEPASAARAAIKCAVPGLPGIV